MSYAHGTPFLNLAQTVGTDHRDWFDENAAKLDLDTKMKTLWDGAASTADILEQLQETVSTLDTDLASLTTVVNGHTTTLQTVNESLVLINSALAALNTDVHTKFDSAGVADPYDPTYGIYAVGDIVTYNGQRYRCTTAVTAAEPFDADKWLAEDIQTVIDGINTDLSHISESISITGSPATGGTGIEIPTQYLNSNYKIAISTVYSESSTSSRRFYKEIGGDTLVTDSGRNNIFSEGGYASSAANAYCEWTMWDDSHSLSLTALFINGNSVRDNARTYVHAIRVK